MKQIERHYNAFEKLLLIVGIAVIAFGMYVINIILTREGWSSSIIVAILVWLVLIFLVIIASITENAREDLAIISKETAQEIRLLRQIASDQIQEIKVLRGVTSDQIKELRNLQVQTNENLKRK